VRRTLVRLHQCLDFLELVKKYLVYELETTSARK